MHRLHTFQSYYWKLFVDLETSIFFVLRHWTNVDGRDGRDGRGWTGRTWTDWTDVDGRDGRGRTGRDVDGRDGTWTDGTDVDGRDGRDGRDWMEYRGGNLAAEMEDWGFAATRQSKESGFL